MKKAPKNNFKISQGSRRLILDFGNTLTKIAIFIADNEVDVKTFAQINLSDIENVVEEFEPARAIASSVVAIPNKIEQFLKANLDFMVLDHKTPVPIINKYKTPETLGLDRLSVAVASADIFPGSNVLAIDAGTCITFDFIDAEKNYLGGGISPGINMRFKALNTFTERLPLIKHQNFNHLTGATTRESILSGVLNGVAAEIDGIISLYQDEFSNLKVIVTGGDMNFFVKKLKSNIFASPNLVLKGLNVILNFNVEKEQTSI